jgi:hypothetical protein
MGKNIWKSPNIYMVQHAVSEGIRYEDIETMRKWANILTYMRMSQFIMIPLHLIPSKLPMPFNSVIRCIKILQATANKEFFFVKNGNLKRKQFYGLTT